MNTYVRLNVFIHVESGSVILSRGKVGQIPKAALYYVQYCHSAASESSPILVKWMVSSIFGAKLGYWVQMKDLGELHRYRPRT